MAQEKEETGRRKIKRNKTINKKEHERTGITDHSKRPTGDNGEYGRTSAKNRKTVIRNQELFGRIDTHRRKIGAYRKG